MGKDVWADRTIGTVHASASAPHGLLRRRTHTSQTLPNRSFLAFHLVTCIHGAWRLSANSKSSCLISKNDLVSEGAVYSSSAVCGLNTAVVHPSDPSRMSESRRSLRFSGLTMCHCVRLKETTVEGSKQSGPASTFLCRAFESRLSTPR